MKRYSTLDLSKKSTLKNAILATAIAITALCGAIGPAQADLTGPKPPKITPGFPVVSTPISPAPSVAQ